MQFGDVTKLPSEISRQLGSNEDVLGAYSGNRIGGGKLVCTSWRVLLLKRGGSLNKVLHSYHYEQISSVHVSYGKWWQPIIGGDSMTLLHLSVAGVPERVEGSDLDRTFAPNVVIFGAGKKQHALAEAAASMINDQVARVRDI